MKNLILLVLLVMSNDSIYSQKMHVNVYVGTSNYVGELFFGSGKSKLYNVSNARQAAGLGVEYNLSPKLSVRSTLTYGTIGADDKKNPIVQARNLNFTTSITDLMVGVQYYILNPEKYFISPYIFTGIAVFHFNPYTHDKSGRKVYLRPLSTEGQGFVKGKEPYKLTQIAIPYGAGLKVSVNDNVSLGVEISSRKTFTDYIDDVSTNYVDMELLLKNRGQLAVDMAFRGGELDANLLYPDAGAQRGIDWFNDRYYFSTVTASIRLQSIFSRGGNYIKKCPRHVL